LGEQYRTSLCIKNFIRAALKEEKERKEKGKKRKGKEERLKEKNGILLETQDSGATSSTITPSYY
jgi:hypothetical protein